MALEEFSLQKEIKFPNLKRDIGLFKIPLDREVAMGRHEFASRYTGTNHPYSLQHRYAQHLQVA